MRHDEDLEHLRLLAIFHYIVGGVAVFFALFPLIHFGVGLWMLLSPESLQNSGNGQPPVEFIGYLFVALGLVFVVLGQTMAWLMIYSGRQIQKREKYMLSFVMACVMCMFIPFGTILGVFTIIVLSRDSVKRLYGRATSDAVPI